MITTRIKWSTV